MTSASPILNSQSAPVRGRAGPTSRWIEGFLLFQMICQLALLMPGLGMARMLVRMAAFGASLLLIALLVPRGRKHPSFWLGAAVLGIIAFSVINPATRLIAGVAQVALYAAILAPLWWVAGVRINEAGFRRILLLLWGFHTFSALVGVVQVMVPGALTPQVSSVVQSRGDGYVDSLMIPLANGQRVFRPMGLSDAPGGAATAGFYVVLLGLALWGGEKHPWLKIAYFLSMPVAMFVLYLSQVRSMLVMTGICTLTFIALLALRGEMARVTQALTALAVVIALSFAWAMAVGGETVTKRLSTLVDDDPSKVYYSNRGHFLARTVLETLPRYPLGAGVGKWGMMAFYFGGSQSQSDEFWAEIQWTGWLLDGGVPLVLLYAGALGAAIWLAGRLALRCSGELAVLGALVFAYNIGALAVTFNYPLFIGQGGLEFWLLNACLFGAWVQKSNAGRLGAPAVQPLVARPPVPRRPSPRRLALPPAAPDASASPSAPSGAPSRTVSLSSAGIEAGSPREDCA